MLNDERGQRVDSTTANAGVEPEESKSSRPSSGLLDGKLGWKAATRIHMAQSFVLLDLLASVLAIPAASFRGPPPSTRPAGFGSIAGREKWSSIALRETA
jgi:hypothetical protein